MQTAEKSYQLLSKHLSVADFEQWVYNTPEIETVLSEDDYLALISLNYKSSAAFYELQQLLSPYVNWAGVRRQQLVAILQTIVRHETADETLVALSETYNWYCRGYSFLQDIAFSFLSADHNFDWHLQGEWNKETEGDKHKYLARFYPEAQKLAEQLIHQLESGRIQLHILRPEDEITYTEIGVTTATERSEPSKN